jgi:hypothetical protein
MLVDDLNEDLFGLVRLKAVMHLQIDDPARGG